MKSPPALLPDSPSYKLALVTTSIVGFSFFYLQPKLLKRIFDPALCWIRTKILLKPSKIIIAETQKDCSSIVKIIKRECKELRYVGFDCEWVPNFVKGRKGNPVALLQLATPKGTCALIRLSKIGFVPKDLKIVLKDSTLLKVGVASHSDAVLMHQDHNTDVKGCIDLRVLCESENGLAKLAHSVLGVNLEKNSRISCSNWAAKRLSENQTRYAALDALVAVLIFSKVTGLYCERVFQLKRTSKSWSDVSSECSSLVDAVPKRRGNIKTSVKKDIHRHTTIIHRKLSTRAMPAAKYPVYDNCMLLAPDGEILAACQRSKAEWYVSSGLAEVVENVDNQATLTVRLLFEPKVRSGKDGRNYYATLKRNICVVCGSDKQDSLVKRCIVPREYKIHFPDRDKDHKSHDVLVLCVHCNVVLDSKQSNLRKSLAEMCNAPIVSKGYSPFIDDPKLNKVRSAGRALSKPADHVAKIPQPKILELRGIIAEHFQILETELTDQHILEARNINSSLINGDYKSHGSQVVKYFEEREAKDGGLFKLEKVWRSHFLQQMKPQFMPELWSIDHQQ
ncbi:exonuclease 3'-5' domain-containing protein 2 [Cloeon dipterum]|uniref:exonuclease 3'-5' domain-containing protein 2 n=1 Tax=Cloeon dipterum TaxID=197152 RepID=UPI0032209DC6